MSGVVSSHNSTKPSVSMLPSSSLTTGILSRLAAKRDARWPPCGGASPSASASQLVPLRAAAFPPDAARSSWSVYAASMSTPMLRLARDLFRDPDAFFFTCCTPKTARLAVIASIVCWCRD